MVMIVEKPSVNVALAQGVLDGGEVHIQTVILHDRWRRWIRKRGSPTITTRGGVIP
jgi:hypothetical protein